MDWMKAAAEQAAKQQPVPVPALPALTPGRVVHIDGDYCAYYCSGNEDCSPGQARRNLLDRIETAKIMSGANKAVLHITMPGSHKAWRYAIATVKPYQGQRGGARPANWEFLRAFMEDYTGDAFTVKRWTEREADDGIALAAYHTRDPVTHTRDKDMRMLPGLHLNWMTYQLIQVGYDADTGMAEWDVQGSDGLQYGIKWFALQLLQGDAADWIPGLPRFRHSKGGKLYKVGEKTAQKAIQGLSRADAFNTIYQMYESYYEGDWANRFAEQASLLWLRTDPACDWKGWLKVVPEHSALHGGVADVSKRIDEYINQAKEYDQCIG